MIAAVEIDPLRSVDAIVIGASAGGIEALMEILPGLTSAQQVAVLVVIHLPRERPSLLVEVFRPRCALAVEEAQDKADVRPGTIYFAPPDYHMLVDRGPRISLSFDAPVHFSRPSIDVLFQSAADVYGERLMGIILTGGNEDGAEGLAAVRGAGGVTVVQRPDSAQVSLMPAAALAHTPVDYVLSPADISRLLKNLPVRMPS